METKKTTRRVGVFTPKALLEADDSGKALLDTERIYIDDVTGAYMSNVPGAGVEKRSVDYLRDSTVFSPEELQLLDRNAAYKEARKGLLSRGVSGQSVIGSR